jgi:hypothetical protein
VTRPLGCMVAIGFSLAVWALILLVAAFLLPGPW